MIEKVMVKIRRFDPTSDQGPWYETYQLPPGDWEHVKVVDVLKYIYENYDPGLSFREPCRQGFCKACAVKVNERVHLACSIFAEESMVIEPLPNRSVIKDLVTE